MRLQEQIDRDWQAAMKARDPKKDVLSLMRTELKNLAIAQKGARTSGLSDDDALGVLSKMAKQRRESIAEYEKGGRADLVGKERAELAVIDAYLPAQLDDDAISTVISEVKAAVGATSMKDMGKLMGPVMQRLKGQADGKRVQALVKEALS